MIRFIYCLIFIFFIKIDFIQSQNLYRQRREYLIGQYSGVYKDSTNNGPWIPVTFDIVYSFNTSNFFMDSMCYSYFSGDVFVFPDTSIHYLYGGANPPSFDSVQDPQFGGKLFYDSSFVCWYTSFGGPQPSKLFYFTGKKNHTYSSVGLTHNMNKAHRINLYPNPTKDYVVLDVWKFSNNDKYYYKIYSSTGNIVEEDNVPFGGKINLQNLPNGIFYINVNNGYNSYYSLFIKE